MTTKPRIIHVITRLIAGGAQENTILSCAALQDRYDLTLVTGPPDGPEGSLLGQSAARGIRTVLVPELVRPIRPGKDSAALARLSGLFEAERPDLVHTHSSKAGILGRAAAWSARVPFVVHTNHGLPFYPGQPGAVRLGYWALEWLATRVTDRVICVGEEMRRKFVEAHLGPDSMLEVVPSGIETEAFTGARSIRASLGLGEGEVVVGIVSRMASHKGHRFLLEAARPEWRLLLVGDGEERTALERQAAKRGLRALFTGHVPPEAVPDLIASMDVLVHPSLWEGLPRAAVQSLLVGRPVVAFDCDGAREVVKDGVTGRLVPPKSVEGLRSAVEGLLARPDRGRSLGEAGREAVRERFEWRVCAERLDRVYRKLLGTGVKAPSR
jgi:glycosyltransferase involved in cell wall biosynthesis